MSSRITLTTFLKLLPTTLLMLLCYSHPHASEKANFERLHFMSKKSLKKSMMIVFISHFLLIHTG